MGNNTGACFRTDEYYFFGETNLRFCERFAFTEHEYINCFSALIIILIGFYMLFFYQHNISLLRFISSSLMFNGGLSFLNHWYGQREWLFMDNISIIIPIYLLLKVTIDEFIENYDFVIISSSTITSITKKYGRAASLSVTETNAGFDRQQSVSTTNDDITPQNVINNVINRNDFISRPIPKLLGWIICVFLIFFFIIYNINGCNWDNINNQNLIFIIFILIIPFSLFILLILFYVKSKANDHQIGTIVHSADMADLAFKYYVGGVIMIFIGNIFWIITEEACKNDNGWKVFPGLMVYNLFTVYGYSLISVYIIYLNNDLQRKVSYFQSLHERKLNQCFVWFHWLFPSIQIPNNQNI